MVNRLFTRVRKLDRAELIGLSILSFVCLLVGLTAALAFTPSAAATSHQAGARTSFVALQTPAAQTSRGNAAPASTEHPNILFIMGDDIGWMQPSIYHRGLMVGETPNIDRIGKEGAIFMDYVADAELHLRAQRLLHRHVSAAHGDDPAAASRQPVVPAARAHRRSPKFLHDLGYTTGEFGKNHLGDHTAALPTAHGFQEYWGYLYHLDAMQQVSFPDINSTPTQQGVAPPCKNTPIPGVPEVPGAVDPQDNDVSDASAPGALVQILRRHGEEPDPARTRGR